MNVGILGGTFNPVHTAHLIIGEWVRTALQLDSVLFIPCNLPPHKGTGDVVPGEHRLAMIRLAIAGHPAFEVSGVEIERGGVSYTVETLEELSRTRPDDRFWLLLGMDNAREFSTWRDPSRIEEMARLVVMTRPGFESSGDATWPTGVVMCPVPALEISSSLIRRRVASHVSIRYLVPEAVEQYIQGKSLYRVSGVNA
jgi:nicotinate-nucleotide adenylyltransferase